jgi:uncharacterized protein involved in cysteine biosynthesis
VISALARAFGQLPDPPFRRVIFRTFLWSAALSVALFLAASWGVTLIQATGIGWLDGTIEFLGAAAAFVIAILLFPGLAAIVVGFFLEDIARAVEARHYPNLSEPRRQPLREVVWAATKLAAITVVLNLLILPVYLVPVINVFVFYGLNGYLLGREYFELAALRRTDDAGARQMRRRHRTRVFIAGVVITFLLSIPFVNWFMPVIAAAFIVHEFERLRSRAGPD